MGFASKRIFGKRIARAATKDGEAAGTPGASPDLVVAQVAGLVAQPTADYFGEISKLALASQGALLKKMTEALAEQHIEQASGDALRIIAADLLMGAAAAVAAAAGATKTESTLHASPIDGDPARTV